MSGCLFMVRPEKFDQLNSEQLIEIRDQSLKTLSKFKEEDKKNKFKCDQYAGAWENLCNVVRQLDKRYILAK